VSKQILVLYIEHEVWWEENEFRVLTIEYPHSKVPPKKREYYLPLKKQMIIKDNR